MRLSLSLKPLTHTLDFEIVPWIALKEVAITLPSLTESSHPDVSSSSHGVAAAWFVVSNSAEPPSICRLWRRWSALFWAEFALELTLRESINAWVFERELNFREKSYFPSLTETLCCQSEKNNDQNSRVETRHGDRWYKAFERSLLIYPTVDRRALCFLSSSFARQISSRLRSDVVLRARDTVVSGYQSHKTAVSCEIFEWKTKAHDLK